MLAAASGEIVQAKGVPELGVMVAGQHCGYATAHGSAFVVGGDLQESVSGVLRAPRDDGGVGQDRGPGEQFGRIVNGRADVADDVELTADSQQDGELARVLGRIHSLLLLPSPASDLACDSNLFWSDVVCRDVRGL